MVLLPDVTRTSLKDLYTLYRDFANEEEGSMTIFGLFMVFIMMMVSGIGVDMMRHEMERTRMQAVADRAVLAAADLDQTLSPEDVVRDYFAKADMTDYLTSVSVPTNLANAKVVTVEADLVFPTMFMDFLGVDTLSVPAAATAEERVPKVEISLALDITTSMDAGTRIADLKPAAIGFIDSVLDDESTALTSVSLIPYGGQVNPGPVMFEHLGGERLAATPLDEIDGGVPENESHGILPALKDNGDPEPGGAGIDPNDATRYVWPNQSSCPEIQVTGFNSTALPPFATYEQTPYFSIWNNNHTATKDVGWCPDDVSQIQYLSNDRTQINETIENMLLYDGTGTQYAMQWALALLDPSSADDLTTLGGDLNIPSIFNGRPAAYDDSETLKYIILMTDGGISIQYRPNEEFGDGNVLNRLSNSERYTDTSKDAGFARFNELCDLAKSRAPRPIIIYTIAFETRSDAEKTAMRDCASSESHFFASNGAEIADTFQSIARQISQLKLTQ